MRKKACSFATIILTLLFLLPPTVITANHDGDFINSEFDQTMPEFDFSDDIFNVRSVSGAAYDGYIFRLADNVIVPFIGNENIQPIFAPYNLFRANTIQDIIEFADPELVKYVEPDYLIFQEPTSIIWAFPFFICSFCVSICK